MLPPMFRPTDDERAVLRVHADVHQLAASASRLLARPGHPDELDLQTLLDHLEQMSLAIEAGAEERLMPTLGRIARKRNALAHAGEEVSRG